jgi:tetratricopeptide (TPR) repeat protein
MVSTVFLFLALAFPQPALGPWYGSCSEGDWLTACEEAAALLTLDSSSVEALAALMISTVYDGTDPGMIGLAKAAVAMDSTSALAWTAAGTVLFGRGESFYGRAEESLLRAAELDGTLAPCWFALGLIREMQGDPAGALEFFRTALEVDSGFFPAGLQFSRVLRDSGLVEEALDVLTGLGGTGCAIRRSALAEEVILLDSLHRSQEADSIAALLCSGFPSVWLELARYHVPGHPARSAAALSRAEECPDPVGILAEVARIRLDLGDCEGAGCAAREALAMGGDTTLALTVLGESLLETGHLSEAEEAFLEIVDRGSPSVTVLNSLGWISEQLARTAAAVDHYLTALEQDPSDPFARERLLVIADDSYDPYMWGSESSGLSANCAADLTIEHGNREVVNAGGSALVSWQIDTRGTSVDLGFGGRSVTWETDIGHGIREERQTDTGWATLSTDYWFTDHLYLQASSSWDRQRFSSRPWQVSSYIAGGLQKWLTPWLWLSPELGAGFVTTKWVSRTSEQVLEQLTVYSSAGLSFEKPHTFIQRAEISGEIYIPPDSPGDFLSSGRISMAFRTWEPLYLSIGYEVDYPRVPEIATWKKFDTRFVTSVNFTLL